MKWMNKLRQLIQPKQQAAKQPTQHPQQIKNARIKKEMAQQKPVQKVSNMTKAQQQANTANARAGVKATAKNANSINAPTATGTTGSANSNSYKPKGISPSQKGKTKGKGRSL